MKNALFYLFAVACLGMFSQTISAQIQAGGGFQMTWSSSSTSYGNGGNQICQLPRPNPCNGCGGGWNQNQNQNWNFGNGQEVYNDSNFERRRIEEFYTHCENWTAVAPICDSGGNTAEYRGYVGQHYTETKTVYGINKECIKSYSKGAIINGRMTQCGYTINIVIDKLYARTVILSQQQMHQIYDLGQTISVNVIW